MICRRPGLSLLELLVVVAILAMLISLILSGLGSVRESARRTRCVNRLRQIGLATLHYESAHSRFPPGRVLPDWVRAGRPRHSYTNYSQINPASTIDSTRFHSVHARILPFLESDAIYRAIDFDLPLSNRITRRGRPVHADYRALAQAESTFICPSDPFTRRVTSENNYRYNFGGSTPYGGAESTSRQRSHDVIVQGLPVLGNGAFSAGPRGLTSHRYVDGLSHTAFFSERTKGSGRPPESHLPGPSDVVPMPNRWNGPIDREVILKRCLNYRPAVSRFNFTASGRWLPGSDYSNGWPFAAYSATMYNHVAPPNWVGQDCGNWSAIPDTPGEHAVMTARSQHPHIVNVCFGDGHVAPVADSIELSIWRALGTRDGRETIERH